MFKQLSSDPVFFLLSTIFLHFSFNPITIISLRHCSPGKLLVVVMSVIKVEGEGGVGVSGLGHLHQSDWLASVH